MNGVESYTAHIDGKIDRDFEIVSRISRSPKISKATPLQSARLWREKLKAGDAHGLHFVKGEFFRWSENHYVATPDDAMRSAAYRWLSGCVDAASALPIAPNRGFVTDLLDALKGEAFADASSPQWLDGRSSPDPTELVATANGLLHFPTRKLLPSDPNLFATAALPIQFDIAAPEPAHWLQFLDSIWPDDPESISAIQEWMGLCALTSDTRHQKSLLIVGPRRSGKGTILRVFRSLAGDSNVCAPSFASLAAHFGLQSFIDKRIALISDARLSGRTDATAVAENILRITGEDAISVPRKHITDWVGKLPTRFVVATNELPTMADASAALSSRFIILRMTRSFYGAEDHGLDDKLSAELPGILNWALDGLDRLRRRGRLLQPQSGAELVAELEALASPISMFIAEECVVDPRAEGTVAELFHAWRTWCESNGRDHPGTAADFGKKLRASVPALVTTQRRTSDGRSRCYQGIRLRSGSPDPGTGGTGGTSWHACFSSVADVSRNTDSNGKSAFLRVPPVPTASGPQCTPDEYRKVRG